MSTWRQQWSDLHTLLAAHPVIGQQSEDSGNAPSFEIGQPATEEQVRDIEAQLGKAIPSSFRRVLLEFSGMVDIRWALPEGAELPEALGVI